MPRREDERRLNLSRNHPSACTCKDCTDRFLNRKGLKSANKRKKSKLKPGEPVKRHPVGCACASCSLLGSIEFPSSDGDEKPGIIKKLFGKH